jgi:hypothetical protein
MEENWKGWFACKSSECSEDILEIALPFDISLWSAYAQKTTLPMHMLS